MKEGVRPADTAYYSSGESDPGGVVDGDVDDSQPTLRALRWLVQSPSALYRAADHAFNELTLREKKED
jgi:hypothetical protein